jgi:large subunit ribosomal protein L22
MQAKAISKHVRISPRKVGRMLKLIRGKRVGEAVNLLHFASQRASISVEKTLRSAVANLMQIEEVGRVDEEQLHVAEAYVTQGPVLKRYRPMSMGRAGLIRKRTSHITIVVAEKEK